PATTLFPYTTLFRSCKEPSTDDANYEYCLAINGALFSNYWVNCLREIGEKKSDAINQKESNKSRQDHSEYEKKPFWQSVFVSTTHCSSGCSLGDIAGLPIVIMTGFTIGGVCCLVNFLFSLY